MPRRGRQPPVDRRNPLGGQADWSSVCSGGLRAKAQSPAARPPPDRRWPCLLPRGACNHQQHRDEPGPSRERVHGSVPKVRWSRTRNRVPAVLLPPQSRNKTSETPPPQRRTQAQETHRRAREPQAALELGPAGWEATQPEPVPQQVLGQGLAAQGGVQSQSVPAPEQVETEPRRAAPWANRRSPSWWAMPVEPQLGPVQPGLHQQFDPPEKDGGSASTKDRPASAASRQRGAGTGTRAAGAGAGGHERAVDGEG